MDREIDNVRSLKNNMAVQCSPPPDLSQLGPQRQQLLLHAGRSRAPQAHVEQQVPAAGRQQGTDGQMRAMSLAR